MKMHDRSTSPKEVQLTEQNETLTKTKHASQKQLVADVEITFCTHVGWDGVLVRVLTLGIAGLFVYITFFIPRFSHGIGIVCGSFGACVVVCVTGDEVFIVGKNGDSLYRTAAGSKKKKQDVRQRSKSAKRGRHCPEYLQKLQINGQWFL